MANLSPTTVAINTIAHNVANALDACIGLDASMSEDLRALLRIATTEIDRVRKANRKAAAAAKRTSGQSGKKGGSKRARKVQAEEQSKPAKPKAARSRKAETGNSVITH